MRIPRPNLVIGSRNIPGGGVEGWGVGRHFISKGRSLYARSILGLHIRDLTSGFKAFTRRALEAIDFATVRSSGYSFQIEMTYRAARKGMRIVEVPIVFVDRTLGRSKMSRRIFLEAMGVVWRLRADALRARGDRRDLGRRSVAQGSGTARSPCSAAQGTSPGARACSGRAP